MSHEMHKIAEAEAVTNVEGNMCGPVMRGAVALPGSLTRSRTERTRRNLGDLMAGRAGCAAPVRDGKVKAERR